MDKGKIKVGIETLIENLVAFHSLLKEAGEDQYGVVDKTGEMANSCVATHGTNESNQSNSETPKCVANNPQYKYDQLRSALEALAAGCGAFMVLPEDPNSKLIESIRRGIEEGKVKINSLENEVNRQTNAKNDAINDANYVKDMIYKAAGVDSNQMHWTTALKALVNNSKVRDTVYLDLEIIRLKNVVEQKDKEIKDLREITIRDRDTLARKNNEIVDLENTLVEKTKRITYLEDLVCTRNDTVKDQKTRIEELINGELCVLKAVVRAAGMTGIDWQTALQLLVARGKAPDTAPLELRLRKGIRRIGELEEALRAVKRRIECNSTETTVQLIDEALLGEG